MKIAVTYENGQVFQHFGKTKQFKIYEAKDDEILSSQVIDTEDSGHEALAGFLQEKGVNVLICGGIGMGARNALAETNIQLFAGASGDADEQAFSFINGNLHFEAVPSCCKGPGEDGEEFVGHCGHNCFH